MFGTSRCPAGNKWVCTSGAKATGATKKCKCTPC
jgi:hypothetical protein